MKSILIAVLVLGSARALTAQLESPQPAPPFVPAEIRSITDISSLNSCLGAGTVVLDALITDTGEIQDLQIRRPVPCFTQAAVQGVKDWKFSPATFEGKAVISRMPLAVTFQGFTSHSPVSLSPLMPQTPEAIAAEFQPAEVTRAVYPDAHPGYTFAQGATVFEVALNAKGETEKIKVLRDLPPFTACAKAVLGEWQFTPATFNGRPIPSKIVLAFVSQPYVYVPKHPQ